MRFHSYFLCFLFLCIPRKVYSVGEFPISTAINHQLRPASASSGSNYLVVWHSYHNAATAPDIWGRTVTINGDPLDSFPICEIAQSQIFPNVAWCGDKYLVIWDHKSQEIWGQLVSAGGALVGSAFLIATGLNTFGEPAVASNGNNYLVVWTDAINLSGRMVSSGGSPIGSAFTICSAPDTQVFPKAISAGQNYLVAWQDLRTGNWDIYGQRVSPTGGLVGTDFSISPKAEPQKRIALASHDTCVLVVWEEDHGILFDYDIQGSILDTAMNVLYNDISICAALRDQRLPCADWHSNTSRFIIGWHDYRSGGSANIWIRWMNLDSSLDPEQQITSLSAEQREPDIACSNTCFLIAWEDYRQGSANIDVYGYVPPPCPIKEESKIKNQKSKIEIYPNPFTQSTTIVYKMIRGQVNKGKSVEEVPPEADLSTYQPINLSIYDIMGRVVKTWDLGFVISDFHEVIWDGKDNHGNEVPSGPYFIQSLKSSRLIQKVIKL